MESGAFHRIDLAHNYRIGDVISNMDSHAKLQFDVIQAPSSATCVSLIVLKLAGTPKNSPCLELLEAEAAALRIRRTAPCS